jgi:hypothetical protein
MNGVRGSSGKSLYRSKRLSTSQDEWGAWGKATYEASSRGLLVGWFENDRQRSTGTVFSVQMTPDVAGEENEGSGGAIHLGEIAPDAGNSLAVT